MSLKQTIKNTLSRLLGSPFEEYLTERQQRHIKQFEEQEGLTRIADLYRERLGLTVRNGPFKGLQYLSVSTGSVLVPKLLGCYEEEIIPDVEAFIGRKPRVVIDIGSAEGYYAVGLGCRLPETTVYAFDAASHAQDLCRQMAELNKVQSRVVIRGKCDHEEMERLLSREGSGGRSSLIVCDCDGCEAFLLDPARVPSLKMADVLIETHDHIDPEITPTLKANFEKTHHIRILPSGQRDPQKFPELEFLSETDREKAVNEYRPQQYWMILTPQERPV